jgi:hypothetical protein
VAPTASHEDPSFLAVRVEPVEPRSALVLNPDMLKAQVMLEELETPGLDRGTG